VFDKIKENKELVIGVALVGITLGLIIAAKLNTRVIVKLPDHLTTDFFMKDGIQFLRLNGRLYKYKPIVQAITP
jgi:hypothetical protein